MVKEKKMAGTEVTKPFVESVISRMRKASGLATDDKTKREYTTRVMTLKNQGLIHLVRDPTELHQFLSSKYGKAQSVIILFRPAMSFYGNLTPSEREDLDFPPTDDVQLILKVYCDLLRETTALRKHQNQSRHDKDANAPHLS